MGIRRVWTTTCSAGIFAALAIGSSFAPTGSRTPVVPDLSAFEAPAHDVPAAVAAEAPKIASVPKKKAAASPAPDVTEDPRKIFTGLGAWIDLYDFKLNPSRTAALLAKSNVKTLYLQTGRSNTPRAIHPLVGRWLAAAHARDIKVVGWYLPYYRDAARDAARTLAIKDYRWRGERFDGLGIDIEFRPKGFSRGKWNRNVAKVQAVVNQRAGDFPVAAIPPPPLQMRIARGHWAGFPWKSVGQNSDAVMLMSYWSDRRGCPSIREHCAYGYTAENVKITRRLVGAGPAIHIIGGIGDAMSDADLGAFITAALDAGADGASIYDVATMKRAWWRKLSVLGSLGT